MTDVGATALLIVSATLALPCVVLGFRAAHGLDTRPWERRAGPLGAVALGAAGMVVLISAIVGVVEVATVGSIDDLGPSLLLGVGGSAVVALVLLLVPGARATRGRPEPARIAVARARRSLVPLLVGALLCGAGILLVQMHVVTSGLMLVPALASAAVALGGGRVARRRRKEPAA